MKEAKRIRIIYAEPAYWYSELIGCTFDITGETSEVYHVIVGDINDKYSVGKSHAKVVEWSEPSCLEQQSDWIRELERANKEVMEALQALVIDVEPTIKSYGSYEKCHPLYEEWKDAKAVLEKYAKGRK